jgi:1-deoxy-D-xylulose-5-phosphate reductoisomerase
LEKKKALAIIGSTGELGKQLLEAIAQFPDHFSIEVLTANNSGTLLIEQAKTFKPNVVVIGNESLYDTVSDALAPFDIKVYTGKDALVQVVDMSSIDLVINAISGFNGIEVSLAAIKNRKVTAIANRESMVSAGALIRATALQHGTPCFPLQPQTVAVFQATHGEGYNRLEKVFLTHPGTKLLEPAVANRITEEQANFFNDAPSPESAVNKLTLFEAGLNLIETANFFQLQPEQVDLMIHPESVLDALVQFEDGSQKAMMQPANPLTSLLYPLSYPLRLPFGNKRPYPLATPSWQFTEPDTEQTPLLHLAIEALKAGGNAPCIVQTANTQAVKAFLKGQIRFDEIANTVSKCLYGVEQSTTSSFETLENTQKEVTSLMKSLLASPHRL